MLTFLVVIRIKTKSSLVPTILPLHYRIKRFFSGVDACVNIADAITN
jgi:hypothetical protein